MGMGPCGAPEASTHPDCAPTRSPERPSADSATFNLTQEFADATTTLAANQGLYNGFLAAGLFFGLFTGNRVFKIFFLACVIVAGVFGAATAAPKIFFSQALPAIIALGLVLALDKKPAAQRSL